jgi:prolyl-tRNA editing enzyme YbaK/EbsC (Cys-tRNA(Pro) deacylase)
MAKPHPLDGVTVRRVQAALAAAGSTAQVVVLAATARTAADAAAALGTALGAIVKSLVFEIGGQGVLALVAGDRRCREAALAAALGLPGAARRADADWVRRVTGFAIGGVAPVGLAARLPTVIDASLCRFPTVFAAAGHPHCVFATTAAELQRLTGGIVSAAIAEGP